jgi:hypothetical protein
MLCAYVALHGKVLLLQGYCAESLGKQGQKSTCTLVIFEGQVNDSDREDEESRCGMLGMHKVHGLDHDCIATVHAMSHP